LLIDLVHLSLGVVGIVMFSALAFYCFKLINRFYKGGVFEAPFKAFMAAGILSCGALVFITIAYAFELEPLTEYIFHISHFTLEILVAAILFYGILKLYKAWIKMGRSV